MDAGCKVRVYDPVAMDECRRRVGDAVEYAVDMYGAVLDFRCIVVIDGMEAVPFCLLGCDKENNESCGGN